MAPIPSNQTPIPLPRGNTTTMPSSQVWQWMAYSVQPGTILSNQMPIPTTIYAKHFDNCIWSGVTMKGPFHPTKCNSKKRQFPSALSENIATIPFNHVWQRKAYSILFQGLQFFSAKPSKLQVKKWRYFNPIVCDKYSKPTGIVAL